MLPLHPCNSQREQQIVLLFHLQGPERRVTEDGRPLSHNGCPNIPKVESEPRGRPPLLHKGAITVPGVCVSGDTKPYEQDEVVQGKDTQSPPGVVGAVVIWLLTG